jgi:hypothetical protein
MRVDAGSVARRYRLSAGRLRTVEVVLGDGAVAVDGPELAVVVDGRRWTDDELQLAGVDAGRAGRLAWSLAEPGGAFTVDVVVEADPDAGVVHKRAAVRGRGQLERVELELWHGVDVSGFRSPAGFATLGPNSGPPGLGQPVFGPGFFAGVEHPGAENLVTDRGWRGALEYAVPLGPSAVVTPPAVVGAGDLDSFWDHLDRRRPHPPRLTVLTNDWYHLGAPGLHSEARVGEEAAGFRAVSAGTGLTFDFHCLDDGWDGEWDPATGLWGRLAPARFRGGPEALARAVAPARLGLWVSPFGGYDARQAERVTWGASRCGYEVEEGARLLCPAGDRYGEHLGQALSAWTAEGVGYWKLDGVRFSCADASHGHAVGGAGGRTGQIDRFTALLDRVRQARPDVVLAFTSGSHPSPWWLLHADFLWRGGLDDAEVAGAGSRLDRFATYIDTCLHAYRHCAVPVSAMVTFSVVESAARSYRDPELGLEAWARHCWLTVGRGTLHHDLYVDPGALHDDEWRVLARALAWARRHEAVLARSRMVLGSPGEGQVYGFAARRNGSATVCLRNPAAEAASFDVRLASMAGLADGAGVEVRTVWGQPVPTAGRTGLTLEPFEVLLVELRPAR